VTSVAVLALQETVREVELALMDNPVKAAAAGPALGVGLRTVLR